nr:hypothetical protein [Actinacidiphila acididurans]
MSPSCWPWAMTFQRAPYWLIPSISQASCSLPRREITGSLSAVRYWRLSSMSIWRRSPTGNRQQTFIDEPVGLASLVGMLSHHAWYVKPARVRCDAVAMPPL